VLVNVTVFRDKFARSWPRHDRGDRAYSLDVGRAMRRAYSSDAHFCAYIAELPRRLCGDAIGQVQIAMHAAVFDVDCTAVHGTDAPVPDSWRVAELEKVQALDARGGYRIVYALPEAAELHDRDDVEAWSRFYRIALAYLERRFEIFGDWACSDWTRLFRLPRATRNAEGGPENRAAYGDPDRIGTLTFDPSDEDVAVAKTRSKPAPRKIHDFTAPGNVDGGLLFWALRLRGDVGSEAPRGGWVCRCPNAAQHTINTDGTDSTVVFPARAGGEIGAISCLHGHCANLTLRNWLALFTASELDEARRRAGIAPRGKRAA
jgi:hypothetical protein